DLRPVRSRTTESSWTKDRKANLIHWAKVVGIAVAVFAVWYGPFFLIMIRLPALSLTGGSTEAIRIAAMGWIFVPLIALFCFAAPTLSREKRRIRAIHPTWPWRLRLQKQPIDGFE